MISFGLGRWVEGLSPVGNEYHLYVVHVQHDARFHNLSPKLRGDRGSHSFMWGSSQSRSALPMRLITRVVTKIAEPGNVAIHHEFSM